MTREEATDAVEELIAAVYYYERAASIYVKSAREDYHAKRDAIIEALTAAQ